MAFTEKDLENLLYSNPWLISFDIQYVERIKGDKRQLGRQVKLSNINRRIDLLFKDVSNRPVIVELKIGELKRIDIAQIMEYAAALKFLSGEEREKYVSEFGEQFYAFPKLILIGKKASKAVQAAANIAGIEIRIWEKDIQKVKLSDLNQSLEEWKTLVDDGEYPGITDRDELADEIWGVLNEATNEVLRVDLPGKNQSYKTTMWWDTTFPFCEFSVKYKGGYLLGTFEFMSNNENYRFNSKTWWLTINLEVEQDKWQEIEDIVRKKEIPTPQWTEDGDPVFTLSKKLFKPKNRKKLKSEFVKYISLGVELADKYWE